MGTPYLSEIRLVSFAFAPKGWMFCNGQTMSIQQNQALFALMGTTYGGDGVQTFVLPNLQGRMAMHVAPVMCRDKSAAKRRTRLSPMKCQYTPTRRRV